MVSRAHGRLTTVPMAQHWLTGVPREQHSLSGLLALKRLARSHRQLTDGAGAQHIAYNLH